MFKHIPENEEIGVELAERLVGLVTFVWLEISICPPGFPGERQEGE